MSYKWTISYQKIQLCPTKGKYPTQMARDDLQNQILSYVNDQLCPASWKCPANILQHYKLLQFPVISYGREMYYKRILHNYIASGLQTRPAMSYRVEFVGKELCPERCPTEVKMDGYALHSGTIRC